MGEGYQPGLVLYNSLPSLYNMLDRQYNSGGGGISAKVRAIQLADVYTIIDRLYNSDGGASLQSRRAITFLTWCTIIDRGCNDGLGYGMVGM